MNDSKFQNPYKGVEALPSQERFRFQSHVPEERFNYFKGLRLKQGTIIITVNTLIEKLYHELKRRGIKDLTDRQQFESFIVNCQLVLPDEVDQSKWNSAANYANLSIRSTDKPDGMCDARNVRGTVETAISGVEKAASASNVSSNSKRVSGTRGKTK